MTKKQMACPTVMRINFAYDPLSGKITRKTTMGSVKSGSLAFNAASDQGYMRGGFRKSQEKAHRVAWCIAHGEWPSEHIDHVNGVRSDNRLSNLRLVTNQENSKNQKIRKTNQTGVMGVYWHKMSSKWTAQIMHDGRRVHLGLFSSKEEAILARRNAEGRLGYHKNHGAR